MSRLVAGLLVLGFLGAAQVRALRLYSAVRAWTCMLGIHAVPNDSQRMQCLSKPKHVEAQPSIQVPTLGLVFFLTMKKVADALK